MVRTRVFLSARIGDEAAGSAILDEEEEVASWLRIGHRREHWRDDDGQLRDECQTDDNDGQNRRAWRLDR